MDTIYITYTHTNIDGTVPYYISQVSNMWYSMPRAIAYDRVDNGRAQFGDLVTLMDTLDDNDPKKIKLMQFLSQIFETKTTMTAQRYNELKAGAIPIDKDEKNKYDRLAAGERRSLAAKQAVKTKRAKYPTWPSRKQDHIHIHPESMNTLRVLVKLHGMKNILLALKQIGD